MMDKKLADSLEERERQLRESIADYEKAAEKAKSIAVLTKKQDSLQKDISSYLNTSRPDAGTIKRLTAGLGALSPVDAIYKANEGALKDFVTNFSKSYAKSISDNLLTTATGKDFTLNHKTYKDIITKQMGMKDGALASILGLAGDIAVDPVNFGAMKPLFKGIGKIGSFSVEMASKIPRVEKGIDVLKSQFNIFYEIEKAFPKSSVDKFKDAFRVAAESKNFDKLAKLGFDVSNYTKTNFPASTVKAIPKQFYDVLNNAFGPQEKAGFVGKSMDWSADLFKRVMSWSPKFQTRNTLGALWQGIAEGSHLGDYASAIKLIKSKGATDPAFYNQLKESGALSQTGMFEQAMSRLPAKFAALNESVHRTALAFAMKRQGKNFPEIIEATEHAFYKYNKAYLTPFEKDVVSRVLPFYQFQKGQMGYWPEALGTKAPLWAGMGKVKEDTEPDLIKKFPFLTPDYWKGLYSVGPFANIGFQLEDFTRNITGDIKNWWSQLHPALKMMSEGAMDWNVFSGKQISKNTTAGQYANFGTGNSVNPYAKWFMETWFGPILDPIKNLMDPKKSFASVFTSIRDYDLSPRALSIQSEMTRRQPSFWDHLVAKFGIGPSSVQASTIPNIPSSTPAYWNSAYINNFNTKHGADVFGKQYVYGGGGDQGVFFNASQRAGETLKSALSMATPDIGKNFAASFMQNIANYKATAGYYNYGPETQKKIDEALAGQYEMMRPRKVGETPRWSPGDLQYRKAVGGTSLEQDYNRAVDEVVSFGTKTASLWESVIGNSYDAIKKRLQIEFKSLDTQVSTQYGMISGKDIKSRKDVLIAAAEKSFRELDAKFDASYSHLFDAFAAAETDAMQKIEYQRQADLKKFKGSDDYKLWSENKKYDLIKLQEQAINDKYDKERREQLAKEAKTHMEIVKNVTEEEAKNIIAALDSIYKRGGMSIEEYYSGKLAKQTDQYIQQATAGIDVMQTNIAVLNKDNKNDKLNESAAILTNLKAAISGETDPVKAIELIKNALNLISEKLQGIDVTGLKEAFSAIATAANKLDHATIDNQNDTFKDTETVNKAISEINEYSAKLRYQIYSQNSTQTLGVRSFSGADVKFGYRTTPYAPEGFNAHEEALKANLDQNAEVGYQRITKASMLPGGDLVSQKESFESSREYMMRVEMELERHEQNKQNLSAAGQQKLKALQEEYANYTISSNNIIKKSDEQIFQDRLQIANDMGSMLVQTAQIIFNASGKQSKEAFYAMKALAIIDATIKGYQAATTAYAKGMEAGGPTLALAYAAMSMAFTGAQVGAITSQMVNGPEGKAEGGPIKGGSGRKDDVPIMAMGGEFVIKKSSVQKYGVNFMEALNKGQIPLSSMNFSIPSIPHSDSYKTHYADGGVVSSSPTPITVQLKNESGTPLKQTKSETSFDGQQYVVSVWLDALQRNVSGLRDVVGGQ